MNETIILASGLAAAAAFFAYRVLRKPKGLRALPDPESDFGKFGKGLRLRDLYRLAVLLEEEGVALYLKLAERTQDLEARKLCARLAEEEGLHKQLFLDKLQSWRDLPPNRVTWPKFLEQVKLEGLFADPPGSAATEKELAAFAIKQERHTADFYRMFEKGFPDAWHQERLADLVAQEVAHEERLRHAYPDIP